MFSAKFNLTIVAGIITPVRCIERLVRHLYFDEFIVAVLAAIDFGNKVTGSFFFEIGENRFVSYKIIEIEKEEKYGRRLSQKQLVGS
jgi:hypothetical protein